MQLLCHIGSAPPPAENRMLSPRQYFVTRQPVRIDFQPEDVGKSAYYFARWQTGKGFL